MGGRLNSITNWKPAAGGDAPHPNPLPQGGRERKHGSTSPEKVSFSVNTWDKLEADVAL